MRYIVEVDTEQRPDGALPLSQIMDDCREVQDLIGTHSTVTIAPGVRLVAVRSATEGLTVRTTSGCLRREVREPEGPVERPKDYPV